jgi:hypothetical protein
MQRLGNYNELKDSAQWVFSEYYVGTTELILWCGDTDFASSREGRNWVHKDTGQTFKIAKEDRIRRHGQWTLCSDLGMAALEWSLPEPLSLRGLFLCDIIDHMSSEDFRPRPGPTTRGTFKHLYETKQLRAGSSLRAINDDLDLVVSTTLLHEMFHVVLDMRSQHHPFHPAA